MKGSALASLGRRAGWLAALAVLCIPSSASAHAAVVDTNPVDGSVLDSAPRSVTVTFNESIRLPADAARLYDAKGKRLAASAKAAGARLWVDTPDRLSDGTVVLVWRVVSADGHPIAGSLTYSVGRPSETVVDPPPAPSPQSAGTGWSLLRGLQYLALLLAVGLFAFRTFLLPAHDVTAATSARIQCGVRWAAAVSVAAAVLLAVPGPAESWLVAAVMGIGLAAMLALRSRAAAGGAVVALASQALSGHTRAAEPVVGSALMDVFHLAAGAVWFGGLVGLVIALPAISRREKIAAETLARFSTWAAVSLGVLTVAGAVLTWRITGSWDNLWNSPWGTWLLVKVGVVLVAAVVAGANRFVLVPKVGGAAGHDNSRRSAGLVRRAVAAEASLLVVVLVVTGFLVDRSPDVGRTVAGGQTGVETATIGDLRVLATLAPSTVGSNRLRIQVQDLAGEPLELTDALTVSVKSDEFDLGQRTVVGDDVGTLQATVILPEPGTWRVQVGIRVDEFTNPVATLRFVVRAR